MIKSTLITTCNFVLIFVSYNVWTNFVWQFYTKRDAAFSRAAALIICLRTNLLLAHYVNVSWKVKVAINLICC